MTEHLPTISDPNGLLALIPKAGIDQSSTFWQAAEIWLDSLAARHPPVSQHTIDNYWQEIARLAWYSTAHLQHPPNLWVVRDATAYIRFLRSESGNHTQASWKDQPGWTPFRKSMSSTSVANSQKVLHALFSYLWKMGYLAFNVMAGLGAGAGRDRDSTPTRRNVPAHLVDYTHRHMELTNHVDTASALAYIRDRFLLLLFERVGLRASEAANADMTDVELIGAATSDAETADVFWGIRVRRGKGGFTDLVPLDSAVMTSFRQYRTAFGLSPEPVRGEAYALILSPRTRNTDDQLAAHDARARRYFNLWAPVRSRVAVWMIVTGRFKDAAAALREEAAVASSQGRQAIAEARRADAALLEAASPHWLRHSMLNRLFQAKPALDIRLVAMLARQRDLRHTMRYSLVDFFALAHAMRASKIL